MSENLLIFPTVQCALYHSFCKEFRKCLVIIWKRNFINAIFWNFVFSPKKIMHIPSGRICEAAGILSSFADLGRKEKGSRKMSQSGRSLEIGAHQPGSRNFNKLWNEVILMSRQKRQQLEKKMKGKLRNVMNLRGAFPKKRVRYLHYANGLSTRGIPSK